MVDGVCRTERRTADNGFFPTAMTPKENPFYLDLPFDDLNDPEAFAARGKVIPWADEPGYAGRETEHVVLVHEEPVGADHQGRHGPVTARSRTPGPGEYNDAEYVFGTEDARPQNKRYNGAGMDVSPALNGCLGFAELNGENDRVDWRFVEFDDVPDGPWRQVVTTSQVTP